MTCVIFSTKFLFVISGNQQSRADLSDVRAEWRHSFGMFWFAAAISRCLQQSNYFYTSILRLIPSSLSLFFFFFKKGNGNRFGLCSESLKEIDKLSQIIVDKIHRKNQQIIRRYFQCSRISTRSVFAIRMKTVSALTNRHRASKYQHNLILGADPLNQTKHSSKSNIDSYSFQECITIIRVVPRLVEEN